MPAFNFAELPQCFHVLNKKFSRIVPCFAERCRAARAALVENDNAICQRVEEPAMGWRGAGAGPTMKKNNRHTLRVAAFFPVKSMQFVNRQHPFDIGFKRREEL